MIHGSAVILFVTLNIIVTVVFRSQDVPVHYTDCQVAFTSQIECYFYNRHIQMIPPSLDTCIEPNLTLILKRAV